MKPLRPWLLAALVVLIYALHQDFWNWDRIEPLICGFLPIGLAYHAAYSLLAAALMWVLVRWAWPTQLDQLEKSEARRPEEKDHNA